LTELNRDEDVSSKSAGGTNGAKQVSATNWYGRLSTEKKQEHLYRRRIAYQQKKIEKEKHKSDQGNKNIIPRFQNYLQS
jgi:hypothetical protein